MFQPTACTVAGKLEAGNSIPSSWDSEHHTDIPDEGDKHLSSPESEVLINVPAVSFPEGWAVIASLPYPYFWKSLMKQLTLSSFSSWVREDMGLSSPDTTPLPTWQDGCWAAASHRDLEKVAAGHRDPMVPPRGQHQLHSAKLWVCSWGHGNTSITNCSHLCNNSHLFLCGLL